MPCQHTWTGLLDIYEAVCVGECRRASMRCGRDDAVALCDAARMLGSIEETTKSGGGVNPQWIGQGEIGLKYSNALATHLLGLNLELTDAMFACCAGCEEVIEGNVFGIQPTLCCANCCREFNGKSSRHYSRQLISFSRALHYYDLTPSDLRRLKFKTAPNPVNPFGRPMRLYLGAEIAYLNLQKKDAYIRDAMIDRLLQALEERSAIEDKKDRLQSRMGVKLEEIDPVLRCFILGDYLKKQHACTTLKDVQDRLTVMDRVRSIRSEVEDTHPGAVFDFCVDVPNGSIDDFLDIQRRCYLVFYSLGSRIGELLSEEDKASLKGLSLKKVMDASRTLTLDELMAWKPDKNAVAFYRRFRSRHKQIAKRKGGRRLDNDRVELTPRSV